MKTAFNLVAGRPASVWSSLGWRCVVIIGMLAGPPAYAQPRDGSMLPEALKGIRPAGNVCSREDSHSAQAPSGPQSDPVPDLSCGIVAAELLPLLSRSDTTLVDVRGTFDYQAFRIAGALHMTVSELRTKSVLRTKTVVLVGSGKAERELYAACSALRAHGFKAIKVLRGGMPSWIASGQGVEGRAPDLLQLTTLTSAELWGESRFDANVLLVDQGQEAIQQQLPFAVQIGDAEPATVKALLQRRRKELKNAPLASVVLATPATTSTAAMQRVRAAIHPVPLLVYAESPATFTQQLVQLKAAWTAQVRGPKQPACGL